MGKSKCQPHKNKDDRVISRIDWEELSEKVRKELRNRECHSPTVSTYRWWARRSHTLIGTLIDKAIEVMGPDIVVSDPMSGGGTVAVEAARRELTVYAQDINPWAAFGLETTLKPVDPDELEEAGKILLKNLEPLGKKLYSVTVDGKKGEIVNQLRVRSVACPHCLEKNHLFPSDLIALDQRITGKPTKSWHGCAACGEVTQGEWPKAQSTCGTCGKKYPEKGEHLSSRKMEVTCAHCEQKFPLNSDVLMSSSWQPLLAQVVFKDEKKIVPGMKDKQERNIPNALCEKLRTPIPDGIETRALTRWGFQNWNDLFPQRQLIVVEEALKQIKESKSSDSVKQRLRLAVLGFAEMAGYAARWDPKYLKAYEAIANHRFSRGGIAVEVNPLGSQGRGTLKRRIRMAVKAARWFEGSQKARVVRNSSEKQPIPDQSVDLVITDPPYYDAVQYGELSTLFSALVKSTEEGGGSVNLKQEMVPNHVSGKGHEHYEEVLCNVLKETYRTLKPTGKLILTYHSRYLKAWEALAKALEQAGFAFSGFSVVHSENENDHSKRSKRYSITSDLVIFCVKKSNNVFCFFDYPFPYKPRNDIEKNLFAVGAAIQRNSDPTFNEIFTENLARWKARALFR